jgi:hypothetical protein
MVLDVRDLVEGGAGAPATGHATITRAGHD